MDAGPAHEQVPGSEARSSTGFQPIWVFTEGVTGRVSRSRPARKVCGRVHKWSTPAKLARRQDHRSKHTASGTACTRCSRTSPLDQTQDLLEALPGVTTKADRVVIQEMHLSMAEAAVFVHHELETSRQSIWAQMLNLYDVDCIVNLQAPAGQSCCINGLMLQVEQQNLTTVHGVDAIVHSATPQLSVTAGVITAIAAAVGPAFQSTCLQTLAGVGGQLERGEAAISTLPPACGSQLNCQHIIHAALPHYCGDAVQDEDRMQRMICSVLDVARKAGVTSLAMPLLGCGVAGWRIPLVAKAAIKEVLNMAKDGSITGTVKNVVFADVSAEAVSALSAELARQSPRYVMSLTGTEGACDRAAQWLFQVVKARRQELQLPCFCKLPEEKQQAVLHTPHMQHLIRSVSSDGTLALEGDQELVSKVKLLVENLVAAIKPPYVLDCQVGSFPSCWEPQQSNTQLFEVDLTSSEVAELVQTLQDQPRQLEIVKIHRIQNKKLWKLFALHYDNMQERWSHEPGLHLANGGLPTLWHGTSATEPHKVYATEQGFTFNFARTYGVWGSGTYYSSQPALAMSYEHPVHSSDPAFKTYLAGVDTTGVKALRQILAVDVLTGKAKEMQADSSMRNAPLIEDESIGIRVGISELRYDSVKATHSSHSTPIYITYNSGHGYPKYLITYRR